MNTEHEVRSLAFDLMTQHGLVAQGWKFDFSRQKTGHGQCVYRDKTIELSRFVAFTEPIDGLKNTLLHEIVHALLPGHSHDRVWKMKAKEIGCTGERTSPLLTTTPPPAKYEAKCACMVHKAYRKIRRTLLCSRCRTRLEFLPTGY